MTRIFGVIGHPISHSLSPLMHQAAFEHLGLDAVYAPFEVPPRRLRAMVRGLTAAGIDGLNVTVPLKEAVVPLLDRLNREADALGAVNTIVVRRGRTLGCNTDVAGFLQALAELGSPLRSSSPLLRSFEEAKKSPCSAIASQRPLRSSKSGGGRGFATAKQGWRPRPGRAVILGAGGAAKAVAWALTKRPGVELTIANRHLARAQRLARWLRRVRPSCAVRAQRLSGVRLDGVDLLVNATSLGMKAGDPMPVSLRGAPRTLFVYDLVYNRMTPLVARARRQGCVAANGTSMLVYQGAEAFRLWWRRRPPVAVMRRAVERALRARN